MDGDYRMKKRLGWVMGIALGILLCGAVFYVLCIVEEISTPKKLCTTLQEAIDSNKEFAGYTEVLTQAEANGYMLVVVKIPDQKTDLRIQTGVFLKANKGWVVPAKKTLFVSTQTSDVLDGFCYVDVYRIVGANGYCINVDLSGVSGTVQSVTDSMNSDFGTYSYQSVLGTGYDAWAILPELPDGYTVYVNQEPIVIK